MSNWERRHLPDCTFKHSPPGYYPGCACDKLLHDLFTCALPIEGSGVQEWGCRRCMKVWTVGYSDQLLHDRLTTERCFQPDAVVKHA